MRWCFSSRPRVCSTSGSLYRRPRTLHTVHSLPLVVSDSVGFQKGKSHRFDRGFYRNMQSVLGAYFSIPRSPQRWRPCMHAAACAHDSWVVPHAATRSGRQWGSRASTAHVRASRTNPAHMLACSPRACMLLHACSPPQQQAPTRRFGGCPSATPPPVPASPSFPAQGRALCVLHAWRLHPSSRVKLPSVSHHRVPPAPAFVFPSATSPPTRGRASQPTIKPCGCRPAPRPCTSGTSSNRAGALGSGLALAAIEQPCGRARHAFILVWHACTPRNGAR